MVYSKESLEMVTQESLEVSKERNQPNEAIRDYRGVPQSWEEPFSDSAQIQWLYENLCGV